MRRYYHLLTLRRSKGLFMSHRRCAPQTSHVESHGLFRNPQQQPPLRIFSSYANISKNQYITNALISSYRFHQLSTIHTSQLPLYEEDTQLDYKVTVKGKEVISAASTPANHHWLPLTNLDLLLPPIEAGVFFCYKQKTNMSPDTVVNTIKKSLARVLSTFYPLAGEIVQNSLGEPEVVCNNSGVEFVHAHADVELKELDLYHPDHSLRGKLVPQIHKGLLSVQVKPY